MLYEISLSLRKYLEAEVMEITKVQLLYDNISLSEIPKPFLTIDFLNDVVTVVASGRNSVSESYNFQIGVFANSYSELLRLKAKVQDVLASSDGVPLYDEADMLTGDRFVCDVVGFTRMPNDDIANETNNHRGYFDVAVRVLRNVGSKIFTQ